MEKLVSLIIPVYKVEKYLKRCVESARIQSFENIEIILVDDGSPDACPRICDKFAKDDSRVKVIHQKNAGVSVARNAGLKLAQGKYICFIDSDDRIEKDYVKALVKCIEDNNADFAVCGAQFHGFGKKRSSNVPNASVSISDNPYSDQDIDAFLGMYMLSPWAKIFKKEIITENDIHFLENCGYGEDSIFVYQYLLYIKRASFVSKDLYHYNMVFASATKKYWENLDKFLYYRYKSIKTFLQNRLNLDPSECSNKMAKIACSDIHTIAENYIDSKSAYLAEEKVAEAFHFYRFDLENCNRNLSAIDFLKRNDVSSYIAYIEENMKKRFSRTKVGLWIRNTYKVIWGQLYKMKFV